MKQQRRFAVMTAAVICAISSAVRFVGRAAEVSARQRTCVVCGKGRAQRIWAIDPFGGIYGACVNCTRMTNQ